MADDTERDFRWTPDLVVPLIGAVLAASAADKIGLRKSLLVRLRWLQLYFRVMLTWRLTQAGSSMPSRLTGVALWLAGRKRLALAVEWRAHLVGDEGRELSPREKLLAASGFVVAATQLRLRDAADLAWRPIDAVLGSRTLSNLFVSGPVIVVLVAIVHHDGRFGLVADGQAPVALGAFLYLVIKTGRSRRGVKPPEPKARRARSDGRNR